MKISFDTEKDTYDSAIATLRAAYGIPTPDKDSSEDTGPDEPADDYYPGGWTRKRLEKFAGWLAADAAEAVRYIAAHAPAVSMDEVIEYMGKHLNAENFSGQEMGGRMSSVGFSWKAVPGAKAAPLETDYKYRVYRMDEGIAAILRQLMGEPGQSS
jgi:hypothetical protein